MNILITIIVFIIIFSVLILVHEWGHFIMAKRAGIKVEEFGFGLPPRLWGKKKGETIYSINWIPFGGFVRMYGEDATDPKALRTKRGFAAQPMRTRVKVVVAGVVMNFILAWVLMFVGFTAGMEPLLAPDDVLPAVNSGQVVLEPGVKIKTVSIGSLAEQIGFKPGDTIYEIDGQEADLTSLENIVKNPAATYLVMRGGQNLNFIVTQKQVAELKPDTSFGLNFYELAPFPRVRFYDLKKHTDAYKAGLRPLDTILTVNGQQIYNITEYEQFVRGVPTLEYLVYRDGEIETVILERDEARQVIISRVIPDSPADKAGFETGDIVLSVNGINMDDSLKLIDFVAKHSTENLAYSIERDDKRIFLEVTPEDSKIGVYLSELMNYGTDLGVSVYNIDLLSSVTDIKDVKYPWYQAIYKSLGETWRLSKLTVGMFGNFITRLVADGKVPESVAGPVGIAQMTHVFVQEGIIPLLRFVAILSLSLAVINILPFPALDGGRLLFILIEFVIGRRIPQKWEAYVHAFGYILILFLILAVTYSDILRLFGS